MLQGGQAPSAPAACQAYLETRLEGNILTLRGQGQNNTAQPLHLRYELITSRQGQAGTSRNAQSGSVTLVPNHKTTLSQTSFNVSPADHYQVHLRLLDSNNHVLAHDSLLQ
ncbi:hypothetical protein K3G63_01050 [Hymenobacter sp. HSC-4F20]|uniref:curli-like amyloid fiber formation chaperone CsgH n=1 Tax=Hymenobacter sp. HSC-4F20 TaxID=2864135 RepID=UPI001C73066D|nr:curli-like amyloid fiber formation chaperone CsgH [Hymenobacter sp. HSC-4F20]MBX0289003.1 hypothetical protein [Hymenobacter sp. HSC-4F20]